MRTIFLAIVFVIAMTCVTNSAPVSEAELKNLLAAIRQNRTTQADFQEQRVIRLMKNPVTSSGTVWFQPPNKFRREVKGSSPSVTVSDGRELWIYYPNFKSAERYPLGKGSPLDATVAAINSASQICPVRLCDQMQMVPRQNETQNHRLKPLRRFAQQLQNALQS